MILRLLLSIALLVQAGGTPLGSTQSGSGGGGGGKAFVKSCEHQFSFQTEGSITCVFGSNITAGNAVVCGVFWSSTTVTLSSVAGSSDSYTVNARSVQGNSSTLSSATIFNSVGGYTTVTATFSSSTADFHSMICHEVSGSATAVDASNARFQSSPGHGTDAITSNSFTTTVSGDYIFGISVDSNGQADQFNAGTGYTKRVDDSATSTSQESEDQIQVSSGAITVTFTDAGTGATNTLTLGMGLK